MIDAKELPDGVLIKGTVDGDITVFKPEDEQPGDWKFIQFKLRYMTGNEKYPVMSYICKAWDDLVDVWGGMQNGLAIIVSGYFKSEKYTDKDGNEKTSNKFTVKEIIEIHGKGTPVTQLKLDNPDSLDDSFL